MRVILFNAVFCLISSVSLARDNPCEDGSCVRSRPKGTHFLAELNSGVSVSGGGGLDLGFVLGVGGKLKGFPPRFYLVSESAFSALNTSGTSDGVPQRFSQRNRYWDFALGLRVYLPLHRPLRLFGEVLGGATHASGTLERTDLTSLSVAGWSPQVSLGLGLQLRLLQQFSLGLRSRFVFSADALQPLNDLIGREPSARASLSAGLTWHF